MTKIQDVYKSSKHFFMVGNIGAKLLPPLVPYANPGIAVGYYVTKGLEWVGLNKQYSMAAKGLVAAAVVLDGLAPWIGVEKLGLQENFSLLETTVDGIMAAYVIEDLANTKRRIV